jgi:uncharacterized 2Fe-2S/4Fe-4S cluster protein (DUF4445 family)
MGEENEQKKYTIDIEPLGSRVDISAGETLLAAAQNAGVDLISICGGMGICEGCRVQVVSGELTQLRESELDMLGDHEIAAGFRLACQSHPMTDVKIYVLPESLTSPQRLQVEGHELEVALNPNVTPVDITLEAPTLNDLRGDTTRINDALVQHDLQPVSINFPLLRNLSERLRDFNWRTRLVIRQGELIAALPSESKLLGLAIDIGTTKIAGYLVDLENGHTIGKSGIMNPQIAYGEDVVSRIAYAISKEDGRNVLQSVLVKAINQLAEQLCKEAQLDVGQIVEIVAVGNTAMHHLFAGLPVKQLGLAPYVSSVNEPLERGSVGIGLELAPGANIYLPPNIAGFVGADHVSMLLASEIRKAKHTVVAIDIGTNTEISLLVDGKILSCSCASGPAFEGAHIRDGMRAAPGAIERVQIMDGEIHLQTIGGQPPVGICGSGILDTVAEMFTHGVIDSKGQIQKDSPLVMVVDDKPVFVLSPASNNGHNRDVVVNRKDVNEIQLAKGAIRAGIEILLMEAGIVSDDVDEFIIAGAFGTYLDVSNAIKIKMFPDVPLQRFRQVGNAAGIGAKQMLVSIEQRREALEIIKQVSYIELTTHPDFTSEFLKALYFSYND